MITIYLQHYPPCPVKEKHAKEHHIGRKLLSHGLRELHNIDLSVEQLENEIEKAEHEKPFLKNYPDIHFNISHCDELVACAFSPDTIGFDIEHIVDFSDSILRRVLTDEEKEYLYSFKSDEDKYKEMFCRFWTLKESRIKHSGLGLFMPMTNFSFEFNFEIEPVAITCSEPGLFFYQNRFEEDCFFSICTGIPQDYQIIVI